MGSDLRILLLSLTFLLLSQLSYAASPEITELTTEQIDQLYQRFEAIVASDIQHHNRMVEFRDEHATQLLKRIGKSLNIQGYRGEDLAEAFRHSGDAAMKVYNNPINGDEYQFRVRLPESLTRQCKPYGEDLYGRYGLVADIYIKFEHQGMIYYHNSVKTAVSSHYSCAMNASDKDMERILLDGLSPSRETSIPYWLGRITIDEYVSYNMELKSVMQRTLLTTPGIFHTDSQEQLSAMINEALSLTHVHIQPTVEGVTTFIRSLSFAPGVINSR